MPVRVASTTYQVLDRPDLGKLLVAGDTAIPTDEPGRTRTQAIAARFLVEAGRGSCRLSDGTSAARPYTEVIYRCEKIAAHATALSSAPSPHTARAEPPFTLRMNRL